MFIGRTREVNELQKFADTAGAQFLILYGRRRVGKTTLLLHWVQESGLRFIYWVANQLSPALQLRSFSQTIYNAIHPTAPADADFSYPTWEMALRQVANLASEHRLILILDEFPYAAEAEPALASIVQNSWDHQLKQTQLCLILAGSHIGMMTELLHYHAPLYGRFTGHFHIKALPYAALAAFLQRYDSVDRVTMYAILGGVPAYLERLDDRLTVAENVRQQIFRASSIFRVDPLFLLQDQVREPRNYLSILHAIGAGWHTLGDITKASGLPKQNVSTYLARLADLYLVERRLPVTMARKTAERSRQGRWYLLDSYLRFYFRFIAPNQRLFELELYDALWETIQTQLPSFIGMTAFEELCREWVVQEARNNRLPFVPEDVGAHWAMDAQVDVVAIHWRKKMILLGECKWEADPVASAVIRQLVESKTAKVLALLPKQGTDWQVHYLFFARAGFSSAAQATAGQLKVRLVSLHELDQTLCSG
ncbi:MAG: ATP-binding protein [Caldilinea sp. CFX5]|nr:ATP-binding protein [Caldilinea sp. CFX5]